MKKICGLAVVAALASLNLSVAEDSDLLRLRGVSADRTKRIVEIDAYATGIAPAEPVEFVLLDFRSGHDYEALAATKAEAEHIKRALEFIGVQPGRPVDESRRMFWPRGGRLSVSIELTGNASNEISVGQPIPVEKFLYDVRTDASPQRRPFVFVGSRYLPNPTNDRTRVLAAEFYEPRSIISTYNESTTLIDPSWRAPQESEYGKIVANPDRRLQKDAGLKVVLQPWKGGGAVEEVDLTLSLQSDEAGAMDEALLVDRSGQVLNSGNRSLVGVLSRFEQMMDADGQVPYVVVEFDPALILEAVAKTSEMLAGIDEDSGIRIEPPPSGQLYYKAFLPNPIMFDRDERGLQPPEIHFDLIDGEPSVTLKKASMIWSEDESGEYRIEIEEWALNSPDAFAKKIAEIEDQMPILLVYAPEKTRLKVVMDYVEPVMKAYPTVFVLQSNRAGKE